MATKKSYYENCLEILEKIETEQGENLKKAGKMMGDVIMADKLVHVIGNGGHAHIPAYDLFFRAGGLAAVNYVPAIGSHYGVVGATHGMRIERLPGYMNRVIDYYRVQEGEVAIIFNVIGVNAATIDSALECKERGCATIGVAGSHWMKNIPLDHYTRHPSKKNLMDIVDLFIDNYNKVGDCVLEIEGFDRPYGPISSISDAFIARRMEIEAIEYMVRKGFKPPVYMSANRVGGDQANEELINRYYHRIKNL